MLYSEFVDRTGYTLSEERYHKDVEPSYYDYPGNKDEFCRDWLVSQLALLTKNLQHHQRNSHNIKSGSTEEVMWSVSKKVFSIYTKHLSMLVEKLNKYYPIF